MKYLIITITLILNIAILSSQQYTNVIRPFSEKYNVNIESIKGSSLPVLGFEKSDLKLKELTSDSFARNLNVEFDLKENGIKYKLENSKYLYVARIKLKDAKTLNFSFDGLYLNKGSKLVIYSSDKKQIIGPITPYDNSLFFTTHVIFSNDVYFELVTNDDPDENVSISKIAYGVRDYDHFIDTDDKFQELTNNNNSKNPGVQNNCNTYTQSDFDDDIEDTRNQCNHFSHYDYGSNSGLKEANCSGFEKIEKSKRAEVIIASYDCVKEVWEWKPGILINTADTSATNYCNSYILTCKHCIAGHEWVDSVDSREPTYLAVRFNWIRNKCDLSQMPSCSSDPQAWKDLINFDEVIDYTDVDYVSGIFYYGNPGREFAFLKINTPLKFKEFYNGWRIIENSFSYREFDTYLLGATGNSPLVAREQTMKYFGSNYTGLLYFIGNNGDSVLINGNSGSSVLDTNSLLLGISTEVDEGPNMGYLYANSPWPDTIIKPREILDENEIYLTDFNNKDEIIIEGAERYEKGDCLFSTTTCNPSLDLSEYLTPLPDDGCCFRLDYIDSLDGFMGGLPYGIRIYRDNETQQTLYYDFGAHVFAGTELDYYDETEDNVITFCLDSNELSQDGGNIVIEFQDNNGKIICVKTVEVECLDCCSEDNMQIYLDFDGPPGNEGCCANIEIDVDSTGTFECDFEYALVYDASDSTLIAGGDLVTWKDTLLTIPFTFCNYDSVNKYFRIDFYNSDSLLLCSRTTTIPLPPCDLSGLKSSGGNNIDEFDITQKELKQDEITFEYQIPKDEEIEIELVNKYNVSLGVIHEKSAKKGKTEFKLNLDKYKSGIYVIKMKSKSQTILRKWIIE